MELLSDEKKKRRLIVKLQPKTAYFAALDKDPAGVGLSRRDIVDLMIAAAEDPEQPAMPRKSARAKAGLTVPWAVDSLVLLRDRLAREERELGDVHAVQYGKGTE